MKYALVICLTLLFSCQGKLTDEQKKELKEGMEANRIKKISQAEILNAAFNYGREIAKYISYDEQSSEASEAESKYHVKIYSLQSGDSLLMEIEKQIIEAYTSTSGNFRPADNVQNVNEDSLLYTLPVMDTLQDGSTQFKYALGIMMPKKEVILSIKDN